MNLLTYASLAGLVLSVSLNIVLLLKKPKKSTHHSLELREFLADLDSGGAMLAVMRMDPESFLLRSPKK